MKKLFFTCLLAGTGQLFAQNLAISDFQLILNTNNAGVINDYLLAKGFITGNKLLRLEKTTLSLGKSWYFKADNNPDAAVTSLLRQSDSSNGKGIIIGFETSNVYFYSQLMNQLPDMGFYYRGIVTGDGTGELCFSNGREELRVTITKTTSRYPFQFTFQQAAGGLPGATPRKRATTAVKRTKAVNRKMAWPVRVPV
jgi:hypothetical protein